MKKAVVAILSIAFLGFCHTAAAQDGVALPFLRITSDPESMGMACAGAASSYSTAYASFRNPSVIPFSRKKFDVAASFQNWAPDGVTSKNYALGAALKVGEKVGLTIGGVYDSSVGGEYALTDSDGNSKGTFTPSNFAIGAGVAYRIIDSFGAGVNLRYASTSISDDDSYSSFGGDFFLYYKVSDFGITAGVSTFGQKVESADGSKYSIPTALTVAGDWFKTFGKSGVRVDLDADYFFSGDFTAALGAQYSFKDIVFIRAGYHLGSDDAVLPSFATAGAGFQVAGVRIDFAYLTANAFIGNTITVGLGYSF